VVDIVKAEAKVGEGFDLDLGGIAIRLSFEILAKIIRKNKYHRRQPCKALGVVQFIRVRQLVRIARADIGMQDSGQIPVSSCGNGSVAVAQPTSALLCGFD
jgi:hypothetical protein